MQFRASPPPSVYSLAILCSLTLCAACDNDPSEPGDDGGSELDAGSAADAGGQGRDSQVNRFDGGPDSPTRPDAGWPNLSPCERNEDCESGFCVDVFGADRRECTSPQTCLADASGTSVITLPDETICQGPRSRSCRSDGTFGEASCDRGCGAECDRADWRRTAETCVEPEVSVQFTVQSYECEIDECLEVPDGDPRIRNCVSSEVCLMLPAGRFCGVPGEPVCGDGMCDDDEEECPEDCD